MGLLVGVALWRMVQRPERGPWLCGAVGVCAVGAALVHALQADVFLGAQLLAWAVFLHQPLLLGGCAVVSTGMRRAVAGALAVALEIVAVDAFWVEPHWLEVTRHKVAVAGLDGPVTVALVADLQTDHVGAYEERVIARVRAEAPDLVLFAGDYIQRYDGERSAVERRLRALLAEIRPPLGAFAVQGNVDPPGWERLFDGTAIEPLSGETRRVGEVTITGLSFEESVFGARIPDVPGVHLVLGHAPDFARHPGGDVLLAGHVHGGQVRVPGFGPLITFSRLPRALAVGRSELPDGRTLFVSRGIGMERESAPRIRFLCRPELMLVRLVPRRG